MNHNPSPAAMRAATDILENVGGGGWRHEIYFNAALRIEAEIAAALAAARLSLANHTVLCTVCRKSTSAAFAHLHEGQWIGDECWDERLKITE